VSRLRVLIVDDEAIFTQALRRLLQRTHDVEVANDGEQALAVVRSGKRFDVILSDVMMPAMNGIELFEAVQAVDPEQARHFVFLTGGAFGGHAQNRLRSLGTRQLEKPVDVAALRSMISLVAASEKSIDGDDAEGGGHGSSGKGLARAADDC
jgi:CheY-like chemotaxis protein